VSLISASPNFGRTSFCRHDRRPDGTQGPVAQLDKVAIDQDSEGEATIESGALARLRQYRDEGLDIYRTMGPPYGRYQL